MYTVKLMVTHESRSGTGALIEALDHIVEFKLFRADSGTIGGIARNLETHLSAVINELNSPKAIKWEKIPIVREKGDNRDE